ncbi:MAG: histidine phosphotransferase family protein, partial [Alphaproteobacteria bacterium]|nr:histidine phosphotransferase family protein [Alphaproteobacteria bacterium]
TNPIESANLKRFLLGAVYIMMEPLIRGGICSVFCDAQKIVIKSTGSVCPMRPEYKQLLSQGINHTIPAETRNILCFYLVSFACEANLNIAFHACDQAIELSATYGDA